MNVQEQEFERVGIVFVHGIGEQRRFAHLTEGTLQLVQALKAEDEAEVSVEVSAVQDAHLYAEREFWQAEDKAPVRIHVKWKDTQRKPVTFFLHEVWWADLDDKITLWNQIRFWCWALGAWNVRLFSHSSLPGFAKNMDPPKCPLDAWWKRMFFRLRLGAIGVIFFMAMFSTFLLSYLLRRFFGVQMPGVNVFYDYLGDVKLYQDLAQPGKAYLTDLGEPPRVPIRRRMIQMLVEVWRQDYDRWYLLAHSLGSVLAWNGLMESEHALPNYLDRKRWEQLQESSLVKRLEGEVEVEKMRPKRPVWLKGDSKLNALALSRKLLFAKLRGFVTYGSPLHLFACLWGAIVPINKDKDVFPPTFEWINVLAHTDPVAGKVADIYPDLKDRVKDYVYRASPFLLLSHIRYLNFRADKKDCFVQRLTKWMLHPEKPFPEPTGSDLSWDLNTSPWKGIAVRALWWGVLAASLALFLSFILTRFNFWQYDLLKGTVGIVFLGIVAVLIAGLVRRGYECWRFGALKDLQQNR